MEIPHTPEKYSIAGTILTFIMLGLHSVIEVMLPYLSGLCLFIGICSGMVTIMATLPKAFEAFDKLQKRFKK